MESHRRPIRELAEALRPFVGARGARLFHVTTDAHLHASVLELVMGFEHHADNRGPFVLLDAPYRAGGGCWDERAAAVRAAHDVRREAMAAHGYALAPLEPAAGASARGARSDELVPLLFEAAAVWRWSGEDVHVERFLVRATTPAIWDHYRERRWEAIRTILRPLEPVVERLARRVEREPSELAYAAPCAQMFVFRAEVATTFDEQLGLAERALHLCATHRNARVVVADLLVERALRRLDAALPWQTGDALADAERDCRRAADLYPQLKRLEDATRRLAAQGIRLDD